MMENKELIFLGANIKAQNILNVDEEYYVYPVISLRTDTLVVGSGTEADPYVVQTR